MNDTQTPDAYEILEAIRDARDHAEQRRSYEARIYQSTSMDDRRDQAEHSMEIWGAITSTLDRIVDAATGNLEE